MTIQGIPKLHLNLSPQNSAKVDPINFKKIIGMVLIIVGLFLSMLSAYYSSGPFATVEGVVTASEKILDLEGGLISVDYVYTVKGKEYSDKYFYPASMYGQFPIGRTLLVSYPLLDPNRSVVGPPPLPSPSFILYGLMALVGILLSFGIEVNNQGGFGLDYGKYPQTP